MPSLRVQGQTFFYETEGEGFPLVLTSGGPEGLALWRPLLPLLGELCRVVCTAPAASPLPVVALEALLEALEVPQGYLGGHALGALQVLDFAREQAGRIAGLVLVSPRGQRADLAAALGHPAWQALPVPMLVVGAPGVPSPPPATGRFSTVRRGVALPEVADDPLREQPARLGQVIHDFLLHCERQRHLVRGASLLL
ncbi:MAG: hypothetical protein KatS3mg131_1826 [Candidatus Tectimicrobiota bacterium]|nr:MAG: hypothetical protein KatS3mg131_1826 [Candidatus Tectomicrobia bacterium]